MAEPAEAREQSAAAVAITITFNQASGYGFSPSSSVVANLGTVEFIAPQACWVWTSVGNTLVNAFTGEQSDHVQCQPGGNNYFTFASQYSNTVVTVAGTAVGAPPPSLSAPIKDSLKGTIHVGS